MILDGLIGLTVAAAVVIGLLRGFVQPFAAQLVFALLAFGLPANALFVAIFGRALRGNAIFLVVLALLMAVVAAFAAYRGGGLLQRLRQVRGPDGLFGWLLQGLAATLVMYWLVSGLIVMERAFAPVRNQTTVTAAQARALRTTLLSHSLTSRLVSHGELDALVLHSAAAPARLDSAGGVHNLESIYDDFLRPQLVASRFARPVLSIGSRFPRSGGIGPTAVPRPTPAPKSTPRPSASPSPSH